MNNQDQAALLLSEFSGQDIGQLADRFSSSYNHLFDEDLLFGQSPLERLHNWYQYAFLKKLERMGDEGKRVLAALKANENDLTAELVRDAVAFIAEWYFPGHENIAATVALFVILRKLFRGDHDHSK